MAGALDTVTEVQAAPRVAMLGAELPARFGEVEAECRAVREAAGVFDASFRTWVRMTGEDRVGFLQGMVSNDVKALTAGQGTYATLLTQQGRVVTDLRVYATADHLLLDLPAVASSTARGALERFIVADDVEMESIDVVLLGVEGPHARDLLGTLGLALGPSAFAFIDGALAGIPVRVAASSHAGESGALIGCASADVVAVWRALRGAGSVPVGMEALNVLRVEAGIPWLGVDMDESLLVMEVDLESAISFKKGCYLGQEVVERIAARGHVNRKRTGLIIDGAPLPGGTRVHAGDAEVGWVSSAVRSPQLAMTIGMGYVRRENLAPGTELTAHANGAIVGVRVRPLPFVAGRRNA